MKVFKKQIPVRHILYVVLGWLHATMLCVPLYALVLNFVSEGMTKDVILQNILRGFLILAPIALSWFAIKCLRRIFFYILASIGITVLTGFLFDSVLMAVVALIIIFGVGGMTFNIGSFRLGGIGLAAVTGVLLNLFLPRAVHVHKKVKSE